MDDIDNEVFQPSRWYSQDEVNKIRDGYAANTQKLADRLSEAVDKIIALRARCDKLEKALKACMVGGNHLASQLIDRLGPGFATEYPPDMDPETAFRRLCATIEHDMWVAWAACINARAALVQDKRGGGE